MAVNLQRELLSRLVQGLLRDFAANADALAYWKTRMYKGPLVEADGSIVSPQLTVLPAPGLDVTEPGTAGVQSNHVLTAYVGIYEQIRRGPSVATDYDPTDRLGLLERIILNGSDGNLQGKIIDQINSGSSDPTQKYLNTNMPTIRHTVPRIIPGKAEVYAFLASFQTKVDNITLLRR